MRALSILLVIMVVVTLGVTSARADGGSSGPTPRRRTGTRLTWAGAIALMTGAAAEGTAAGLGGHPGPQEGFGIAGLAIGGVGAVLLGSGLYLRGTSPGEAPDAISLDVTRSRRRWERRVGWSMMGAGALVTAVGIAHVVGAIHDHDLAYNLCPGGACSDDSERLRARSHTLALASLLLLGPGIVGIAGGAALYVGSPDTIGVAPMIAPGAAGAAIVGRF